MPAGSRNDFRRALFDRLACEDWLSQLHAAEEHNILTRLSASIQMQQSSSIFVLGQNGECVVRRALESKAGLKNVSCAWINGHFGGFLSSLLFVIATVR
jgi:hypothetical protein